MEETTVDVHAIAADFATRMHGKMDAETINNSVASLKNAAQSYPARATITGFIFYLKLQVTVTSTGGKTFDGEAGGVSSPGGEAFVGVVSTDDINRLYSDSNAFQIQSTPVYLSVLFFDKNSNLLGSFQAGAISTVIGISGGSGKWS